MSKPKILTGNTGLLFASVGGAVLGNLIPTPGDALSFHMKRKLRDQWTKGEISSKEYWAREATYYYLFNSAWWLGVGIAAYYTPGDASKKLKTIFLVTGFGAALSVLFKNISNDEKEKLEQVNGIKQKLYENADDLDIKEAMKNKSVQ
jgi:hypothetical protein